MLSTRRTLALTLLALTLLPASLARASAYTRVLHAYQVTGTIKPCQFSSAELSAAMKDVDTYGAQYFADFTSAIQTALATRASGACAPGRRTPAASAVTQGGSLRPGGVTASGDASLPAPIILIGAFAALFALLGAVAAIANVRGWEPAWVLGWRHSWSEAGYRVGSVWSEFTDWLRSRD